jgi:hypothetical protein
MKIFLAIVRWFIALGIGGFMLGFVVIAVPVSVFGTQLLDSASATRWINALTNDKKAMDSFTEGVFTGIGKSDNSSTDTDPSVRQVMVTMSNPNSALGKSARKVFTSEIIAKNIKQNAASFYDWLDAKTTTLKFTFYVGGTTADQVELVSETLKVRYEALPVCTTAQKQSIMKDQTISIFDVPCSFGTLQKAYFNKEASDFLTAKEIKPYLNTGAPWVTEAKESDRKSVVALKNVAKVGLIVSWVVVAFSVLFMVLLFTPAGVNWIMTGGIVGLTGTILLGMGGGAVALLGAVNPYGTATESIAEAFGNTLGKPITVQGVVLMLIGVVLIAVGIFKLLKKKPVKKEVLTQSVSTVSSIPAPVVAAPVVEPPKVETEVVKAPVEEAKTVVEKPAVKADEEKK